MESTADIDVQKNGVIVTFCKLLVGRSNRVCCAGNAIAELLNHLLYHQGNESLIFDNQDTWRTVGRSFGT